MLSFLRWSCAVLGFLLATMLLVFQYNVPFLGRLQTLAPFEPAGQLAWQAALPPGSAIDTAAMQGSLFELEPPQSELPDRFCVLIGSALAVRLPPLCHARWRELGPADTVPESIRTLGAGSYTIANGNVLLSTSDGSDPRSNGYTYCLWTPWPWSARLLAFFLLGTSCSLARPIRRLSRGEDLRQMLRSPIVSAVIVVAAVCAFGGLGASASATSLSVGVSALAGLYALPRAHLRDRRLAALFFAAGFALTELTAWTFISLLDQIDYSSWGARQVKYLASVVDKRPILLIMGSSYSQYDIDEDLLGELLAEAGHPMRILRLGTIGTSVTERLQWLKDYLARAKQTPKVALFEISNYYDNDALGPLEQNPYLDRMIVAMDTANTLRSLGWVWQAKDHSAQERTSLTKDVLAHWLLHIVRWPLIGAPFSRIPPDPLAYRYPKTRHFSDQAMAGRLDAVYQIARAPAARVGTVPTDWAKDIYATEIDMLRTHGATGFAYFEPPTPVRAEAGYLRDFCGSQRSYPCIQPYDRALLDQLAHDDSWYDGSHLQGDGRIVFTRWFASSIVAALKLP